MIKTKFSINAEWPKTLTLIVFMASGTFILFSNLLLKYMQFSPAEIVFLYILPWVMLWSFILYDVILSKQHRIEIMIMTIIIILGILNVSMSDNIYQSFLTMIIFILSGIIPLWISMFVIIDDRFRKIMYYICCSWLLIIVIVEIVNYLFIKNN